MAVRSKQLYTGLVTGGGGGLIYTVPTGYRTIIKTISAYNYNAAFNELRLSIYTGASLDGYLFLPLGPVNGLTEVVHQSMFQVLMEGQNLHADATHDGIHFVISGAELLL